MTISLAWSCSEGTGLITDSMWNISDASGRFVPRPGVRTFHKLPAAGAAAVISGNLTRPLSDVDNLCAAITATSINDAAAELFSIIERDERELQARWPVYDALGLDNDGRAPEVLVASSSGIVMINPRRAAFVQSGEQQIFAIGAWCAYFLEPLSLLQRPVPATLDGCLKRAGTLAESYVRAIYAESSLMDLVLEGRTPTCGFPLHAITFHRSGEITEHEIEEREPSKTVMVAM